MGKRDRLIASDAELKFFVSNVKGFLSSNLKKVLRQLESGEIAGARAAQVLGSLQSELEALGLTKQLDEIKKIYGKDLTAIVDRFEELGKKQAGVTVGPQGGVSQIKRSDVISDINRPMVETLIKGGFNQAASLIESHIGDVRQQVALSVLSGQKPDVSGIVDDEGESLDNKLSAEMSTTFAAFHRTVTLTSAEDLGFTLFEYIGPDDQVTRKFCAGLLERDPPIYSTEEISKLDNGQGLPVSQFGGGYRCRHIWSPVTEEEARSLGWKG